MWKHHSSLNVWLLSISGFLLLTAGGCGGETPEDDDLTYSPTPADETPPDEDDDVTEETATPSGDDDDETTPPGDDDDTTPGDDDDTTAPGDDDDGGFGDDDVSFPGGDETPVDGDDDTSPAGEETPTPLPPLPPSPWWTGAMLVVDTGTASVSAIRMSDAAKLWEYSLVDRQRQRCSPDRPCQLFEVRHFVRNDEDYLDYTMSGAGTTLPSSVHRIRMADPETPVFNLTGLDFSAVPLSGCTLPPSETCTPQEGIPAECITSFVHGLQVVSDDPVAKKITVIIADTNSRVIEATLDYNNGNQCAKVNWVLNEWTAGWEPSCPPNDVQYIQDKGSNYMLVSCRNLFGTTGKGQLQFYKRSGKGVDTTWSRVWAFPDPKGVSDPFLNVPHHARLNRLEEGGWQLYYAHSDGLSNEWGIGDRGSIGSAYLSSLETPPDYLADEAVAVNSIQPFFRFLKSVEVMPGGYRLVGDGGSFRPSPTVFGAVYVVEPQSVENGAGRGYWTASHEQMNVTELGLNIPKMYTCGWVQLYQAYWINPNGFGSTMRSAMAAPMGACEMGDRSTLDLEGMWP